MADAMKTEPYVPQLGLSYPEQPDAHIFETPESSDPVLDEHYPFLDGCNFFFGANRGKYDILPVSQGRGYL
jgi:hypothetical protein